MSETEIQHQVLEFCRRKYGARCFARRVPVNGIKGLGGAMVKNPLAGFPDLLLCIGGRFIGLEIKVPGGRLSPAQRITHDAIREAGGIVYVIESLEHAMNAIEGIR